jgi:hypothetical protein
MKNFLGWIHSSERLLEEHEGAESFFVYESETWYSRIGRPLLAVLGLLCHLMIIWLLSFPYTYFEQGICEVNCTSVTTGWNAMGYILIFPLLSYLMYLLSLPWKIVLAQGSLGDSFSDLRYLLFLLGKRVPLEKWLGTSLKFNVLVNLGGFVVIWVVLQISLLGADLYNVSWCDAAYGIHLTLILLAVIASSVISLKLGAWLQRNRELLET